MQNEIKKSGQAQEAENKFDSTADLPQEDAAVEDDGSPVLDEEDLEENKISEEEVDDIEWEDEEEDALDEEEDDEEDDEDEEENISRQGIDKAPGEERGKGDKVTNKDLKGKQVDADPSTKAGKPLGSLDY